MLRKALIPTLVAAMLASTSAHAAADLIAFGSLSSTSHDLSGLTAPLENGVAGDLLGGIGSALAWAGGNTFIATPDRGPNAVSYNSLVDDTTSYIERFQTLSLSLTANPSATFSSTASLSQLAYNLTPTLNKTTLLSSATPLTYGTGALGTDATHTLGSGAPSLNAINGTNYFTGRSDNFNPNLTSTNPNNARLDVEGARVSNDGKSIFVSDEYGPYVYQFDRSTGQRINSFALPGNLAISNLSAQGNTEIANNTTGRISNKGMEGLAITPDGKTLVGIMQAPLEQDTNKNVRIVTIDIASGTTHEYAYQLTTGSGVSEIVALNDHQFLVDERDGKGLGDGTSASIKQVYKIDIAGAQDVTSLSGDLSAQAVGKSLFLDIKTTLNNHGISSTNIPAKIEGMALGDDVVINGVTTHTLFVANDNDFLTTAGNNNFYVFGFTDGDLGAGYSYTAQQIAAVPEPESYVLLVAGLSMMGFMSRRRKSEKS